MNEQPLNKSTIDKKSPEKQKSPIRDQEFYNKGWIKFQNDSIFFRKIGKIRLIDNVEENLKKGLKKRIIKNLLDAFENNNLPENKNSELDKYVFSSKLAIVGTYADISDFLEKSFRQKFTDSEFATHMGFSESEFPLISHDSDYGENDFECLKKFKILFERKVEKELPDYNVFDIIQFRDRLKEHKIENDQKIGFPKPLGKNGNFIKRLKKLSDQNEKKLMEGDPFSIKYFRLSGLNLGKTPTVVKVNPEPKRLRSVRFEHDISIGENQFTLYLILGNYSDNRMFLNKLADEFLLEHSTFDDVLERMKRSTKIKRAPSPTKKSPIKTKILEETEKIDNPSGGKRVIIKSGSRGRKNVKLIQEIPVSEKKTPINNKSPFEEKKINPPSPRRIIKTPVSSKKR